MSKRSLSIVLLVALATAGGGMLLLTGGGGDAAPERGEGAATPILSPGDRPAARPSAPTNELSAPAAAPTPDGEPAAEPEVERIAAASEWEREVESGHWVEGRVVLPPETPADEELYVVAKGRDFESEGPLHKVRVGPDGRFRVSFSPRTGSGKLDLEGRYLHLDEPVRVKVRNPPAEGVTLEAQLGAVVRGRIVLPEGVDDETRAELLGKRVRISGARQVSPGSWHGGFDRRAALGESLEYSFEALPTTLRYELSFDPDVLVPAEINELFLEAGAETTLDLELATAAEISGRVVDDDGTPVNGVQVSANVNTQGTWNRSRWRNSMSDADGSFRIRGIFPGSVTLTAHKRGYRRHEEKIGKLAAGETFGDVEVRLERGIGISGRIVWPDGSPVDGGTIVVEPEVGSAAESTGVTAKADEQGYFELTGVEEGTYRVNARGRHIELVTVISKVTGKEKQKKKRSTWRATARDVETGTSDLVLTLTSGLNITGRVTDETGAPVPDFRLHVERQVSGGRYIRTRDDREIRVQNPEGSFDVDGFEPGDWELSVEADGHLNSADVTFEVPLDGALEPVVLLRAGHLSGTVLGPDGEPVKDAAVTLINEKLTEAKWSLVPSLSGRRHYRGDSITKRDGSFEVERVRPGRVEVVAHLSGFSASEPFAVEVGPGQAVDDITLMLRIGGRITGTVVNADGAPAPRRLVEVAMEHDEPSTTVQSDAAGYFEVGGLAAGTYELTVPPSEPELQELGLSGTSGARAALTRSAKTELAEAGVAHVVLAPPKVDLVRVVGTVYAGSKPTEATLRIESLDEPEYDLRILTDDEGSYEAVLPVVGGYEFQINLASQGHVVQEYTVTRSGQRVDVHVPVGTVRGRVFGPDGKPVPEISIFARRTADESGEQDWAYANLQTDSEGNFVSELLPTGTWRFTCGGSNDWRHQDRNLVEASVEGIVVRSGQTVEDVDLHLAAGGRIEGIVLTSSGAPAQNVRVLMHDGQGQEVDAGIHGTNNEGRFVAVGVTPGTYYLSALGHGEVTVSDTAVTVAVGETVRAELELAPGTVLHVHAKNEAGEDMRTNLRITDSLGRDRSRWVLHRRANPDRPTESSLGPLPPGTYRVTASWKDQRGEVEVTVGPGETERTIDLALKSE
ncbi:MAG: carboxypeptidase-like regulatory domain-containing protein [Planctomycetota bacterium]